MSAYAMVELEIDGVPVQVRKGATVAAALLDHAVRATRTSVDGAPRAPLCGMGTCYECRVTIDDTQQQRACMTVVRPGMRVRTS